MGKGIVIDIPRPPSVNRIWRHRTGQKKPYLDGRYATWKRACDNLCMAHGWHKAPVKGRFTATITLDDTRRSGDADNRIKAVLDFLQRAGIIENDGYADRVTVEWGRAPEGCRVEVVPS